VLAETALKSFHRAVVNAAGFQALTREKRDWCLAQLKREGVIGAPDRKIDGNKQGSCAKGINVLSNPRPLTTLLLK